MKTVAVIDLGTHDCRLTVADISDAGFVRRRVYSKIVRLGEGASMRGTISPRAQRRTLTVLKRMADIIHEEKVKDVYALATEGARMARNASFFFRDVKKQTGLDFKVIDPKEEARLSVLATASLMEAGDRAINFDIGGGSTEVVLVERTGKTLEVKDWISLPYGVVRGRDRFGPNLTEAQFKTYRNEAASAFADFFRKNKPFFKEPFSFIGTSGTVTTLAACCLELSRYDPAKVDGAPINIEEARKFIRVSFQTRLFARKLNPLIGPGRAEYLPSGCAILEGLFSHIPGEIMIAADRGLREGILYSLMPDTPKVVFKGGQK